MGGQLRRQEEPPLLSGVCDIHGSLNDACRGVHVGTPVRSHGSLIRQHGIRAFPVGSLAEPCFVTSCSFDFWVPKSLNVKINRLVLAIYVFMIGMSVSGLSCVHWIFAAQNKTTNQNVLLFSLLLI